MSIYSPQEWKTFKRCANASTIAAGLKDIPDHWSLTPLQDKSPKRDNWQTEPFVPHNFIADLILNGEQKTSKKGNPYTAYWSGFGLRTGEASGGLLAIDIDGESAQPLLEAISGGNVPTTISWTSGKPGRYQLLFQIPDEHREELKGFNRSVLTKWHNLKTAVDENGKPTEFLEFRYNRSQSCLPPSRHPTTGAYHWSNPPADMPVAIAPDWLCQLLLKLASEHREQEEAKAEVKAEKQRQIEERKHKRQITGFVGSTSASLEDVIEQAERLLTADEAFNWPSHNWKHQTSKKWIGYCPRHQSKSGKAFHVNPNSLEWFCHGCNEGGHLVQYRWFVRGGSGTPKGRDFVEIVRELAGDAGISMPDPPKETYSDYTTAIHQADFAQERQSLEPDPNTYATYTAWEAEEERVEKAQAQENRLLWFKNLVKRLKRLGNWQKSASGSGKELPPIQPAIQQTLTYHPDKSLPTPEEWPSRIPPKIIFKQGQRLVVIAKLKELGWKWVCDRSFTGSGKSHDAGSLYPDPDGTDKIWYFDIHHTNPSTETVEGMTNLPPRHNGMVPIEGKFTPRGKPHLKWATDDEVPMVTSLCHNAELFTKLRQKGWNVDLEKSAVEGDDGKTVQRNPICKLCPFAGKCHQEIGDGYGYLKARREAMEAQRIRASIDSAPSPDDYKYDGDIVFVEEASSSLQGTKTLSAEGSDITELWSYVERNAPEAFAALQPFRFALADAFKGKFDRIEKGINRGADHETLIQNLPHPDTISNLHNLIIQVKQAMPTIKDVVEQPDTVTGLGGKWRSSGQFTRNAFKAQANHQTKENIEALPPNVLVDILEVWAGMKSGSLQTHGKKLQVTVRCSRHADILAAASFVVLLDATPNTRRLEKIFGAHILEIEEERPRLSNVTVINVDMKGMGSNQISDSCKSRQLALLDAIKRQHQEVKVLANKADSHLPLDGWWFNDNRGSNAFKGVEVLVAFNTPRPNVGVIQDEYRALHGSLDGFEEYYQELIQSEIVQLIGRQRAHQYPEKQFTLYLIGTNQDLSYLTDLGCQVVDKEAFQIAPEAGTPNQITQWKILQAMGQLQDLGQKPTQEAIASLIGKSQELISKIAKDFGGWKTFKKILLILLGLYRGGNNLELPLTEDEEFLAKTYLPLVLDELESDAEQVAREISTTAVSVGAEAFARIFRAVPLHDQARMLAAVLQTLPFIFQRELTALLEGGGEVRSISSA